MSEPSSPASGTDWQKMNPPLPPVGILYGLNDRSLANLSAYGKYESVAAGTELISEGHRQDRFYIVVSGQLEIFGLVAGSEISLSLAEPGECLGEVALLEPGAASATVRVKEDAVIWSMNLTDLRRYITEHAGGGGALLMGMAQCLSQRIRQANQLIIRHQIKPAETLLHGRERAITVDNTPVKIGFFDRLMKSFGGGENKVVISTKIKM